jgi:1,2-phenylacetyl-CoA epoxidase catalytic subunit
LVYEFAPYLIYEASVQIGLNELRRYFNLKPQPYNFVDKIEEKPEESTTKLSTSFYKILEYFQEIVDRYCKHLTQFKREEIDVAEAFLDKTFPEIRQMFKLKYQKKISERNYQIVFNKNDVDRMIQPFLEVRDDIYEAALKLNTRSYRGLAHAKGPFNYCNP